MLSCVYIAYVEERKMNFCSYLLFSY